MRSWMFGGMSALVVALGVVWLGTADSTEGQQGRPGMRPGQPGRGPNAQNPGNGNRNPNNNANREEKPYSPPDDVKLRKIHEDYYTEAAKLVAEYEKKKDLDKLRVVCEDILRVMPGYQPAIDKLNAIRQEESNAATEKFEILATKGWQDTGITVLEGKPISIRAAGRWTFNVQADLGPGGMEIPEEWRGFNLGSLIGFVYVPGQAENEIKPFAVGENFEFTAEKGGQLFLKMHDNNPEDNKGKIQVEIKGTFKKGKASS